MSTNTKTEELVRCKICGNRAKEIITKPDDSMQSGSVTISCANCGNSIHLNNILDNKPGTGLPTYTSKQGDSGWDSCYKALEQTQQECYKRWNILNARR